jgi:16S rRNA C967 or C1407 C5-methylase (RsmB/RsmF family)
VQEFLASQPEFTPRNPVDALPPQAHHLIEPSGYFRTLPERDGLDGFFAAVLVKQR